MLTFNEVDFLLEGREVPVSILRRMDQLKSSEYFPYFDTAGYQALWSIIVFALDNGWSEDQINKFLFEPVKPTHDQVEIFRDRHEQIYAEQAVGLAELVDSSAGQFFSITSSMYAGKSTLAAEVCSNLAENGYRVIPIVPHFMVESDEDKTNEDDTDIPAEKKPKAFITIRGKGAKQGDMVGPDGFKRIEALPYNAEECEAFFESLNIDPSEKVVIHFDEFSFMPAEHVLQFQDFVQTNYPNIKVLFVGLNKNALGQELDGYTAIKNNVSDEFTCRSFVPNALTIVDALCEPTGTYTSRYVVLPNGLHVLDCGFLPVVVPKEFSRLVYYTPSNMEHHMYTILTAMEQGLLLNAIVNPDEMQMRIRENLFHNLRSAPVEIES